MDVGEEGVDSRGSIFASVPDLDEDILSAMLVAGIEMSRFSMAGLERHYDDAHALASFSGEDDAPSTMDVYEQAKILYLDELKNTVDTYRIAPRGRAAAAMAYLLFETLQSASVIRDDDHRS